MNFQPKPIPFKVLSIDAGSRNGLGICISEFNADEMVVLHVATIDVLDYAKRACDESDRYDIIHRMLIKMIEDWEVSEVVVEDIYCNPRLVLAYRSLVLVLNSVRMAVRDTIGGTPAYIRANVAKNAVGVKSNTGDKDLVNKALREKHDKLNIPTDIGLPYLDQHSNDAVAVGYAYYKERENVFNQSS